MMQYEQMMVIAVFLIISGLFLVFFFHVKYPVPPDPLKAVNYENALEQYEKAKDVADYANRSLKIGGGLVTLVSSAWLWFLWTMPFVEINENKDDSKGTEKKEVKNEN